MVNPFGSTLLNMNKMPYSYSKKGEEGTIGTVAQNQRGINSDNYGLFSNSIKNGNRNVQNPQTKEEPSGIKKLVGLFSANSSKLNPQIMEDEQAKAQMYQKIMDTPKMLQTGRKLNYVI